DGRFFPKDDGGNLQSPFDDFGKLVQLGDGSYQYTAQDLSKKFFDGAGRLTSVQDTNGLVRSYTYDGSGRLQSVTAPDGGVTTLAYGGPGGHLSSITEPGGRVLTVSQSTGGDLLGITDVDG